MAAGARKARLSLGVYETGAQLSAAITALLDSGFSIDQLGIALLKDRVGLLKRSNERQPADWGAISRLINSVRSLTEPEGPNQIVASEGPARLLREQSGRATADGAGPGGFAPPNLRADLEAQIRSGAIALSITCATSEQQWRSTRILLKYSSFPVQTHEFSSPRRE